MKAILIQQLNDLRHHNRLMLKQFSFIKLSALFIILSALFLSGCNNPFSPKSKQKAAILLESEDATQAQLIMQINYFASVNSMRAFMDLKFEDNSYAELGIAEKYKTADGEIVVQRPAKILLKVKVPIIKTDVAQMTSDGENFRVAVLQDGGSGKYRKFVKGKNNTDYSLLQEKIVGLENGNKEIKQNVNAFANLRPQHFTDAMLVRPTDSSKYSYVKSSILQEEFDINASKKSPTRWVLRNYYLIDEFQKDENGILIITRRFWFDRTGKIRLARQQIFDPVGEVESDIVYGLEGELTENSEFTLPLQIEVTRPKEKYKMRLKYQSPKSVSIGKDYPDRAFVLENSWNLEELDLEKKLADIQSQQTQSGGDTKTKVGSNK